MLRLSTATTTAIALHATDQSWVLFVQCNAPGASIAPIKIEGVKPKDFILRTRALATENPFDTFLIGLLPTNTPHEHAHAIASQFEDQHIRDGWYAPSAELLEFIEQTASPTLNGMLSLVHPVAVDGVVTIEEIATMLNVSVPTVRRMVKAGEIPHLRFNRALRFVPADVIASLRGQ